MKYLVLLRFRSNLDLYTFQKILYTPNPTHRGLRTQAPDAFELNRPGQLVIGYHWLAFLNQVGKYLKVFKT